MAYLGNTPTTQAFTPAVDYFSGNGSTTAFTLSRPVASVAQVQVTIDNVAQNPSSAYTVSSNTITFTSAPLSGTNNIYVYYTSPITQVIAPGQGTVNTTALGNITNIASGNSNLTLQTGSGNTTAVTVTTGQLVGVGTVSPTNTLQVAGGITATGSSPAFQASAAIMDVSAGVARFNATGADSSTYGVMTFNRGSSNAGLFQESMRIDSSGNVGIGISNTAAKVNTLLSGTAISGNTTGSAIGAGDIFQLTSNNWGTTDSTVFLTGGGTSSNVGQISAGIGFSRQNSSDWGTQIRFYTHQTATDVLDTFNERMRIDASGKLIMASNANGLLGQIQAGITANSASTNSVITSTCNSSGPYPFGARGETSSQGLFGFFNESNSVIGSITRSGSNVAYNTSSDYRLKENIAPMTGALAKVAQLKPVTYTWKADGLEGEGFIAHELAEVCPHAVSGEKDAVDDNGGIKPQGIDVSFLVATLTAAIQELKAINDTQAETINALTARLEALENR